MLAVVFHMLLLWQLVLDEIGILNITGNLQKHEGALLQNPQMLRTLKWRISRTYNADELLKVSLWTEEGLI